MISSAIALLLFALLTLTLGIPLSSNVTTDVEEDMTYAWHHKTKNSLQLISVVIRHGDRAPLKTYPNDPDINDSMDPYGWGQLTDKGRKNQYNQGLFLRERYDSFLGSMYHPDIFYLQSTARDRTKMSGMLEAAALWYPNKKQTFRFDLPWQPVTLSYQEFEKDTLMLLWYMCPKYAQLRSSVNDLPEIQKVHQDTKQLFAELSNFTGMPFTTVDNVASFYDMLIAKENMNLALPVWTKNYYPDKLKSLYLLGERLYTYNDELRRLQGGVMLKKIIDNMQAKKEGTLLPEKRKMFMYLGHDITVVSLLNTMHIWYDQIPYYNIMVIIELHEDEAKWNVQVFLRNTTAHEPYPMTIPGCTVACPLEKFVEILKPLIPDNLEEECKIDDSNYTIPPPPYL